ncbi:unnamed protein product [Gadus morhua 'NCC']
MPEITTIAALYLLGESEERTASQDTVCLKCNHGTFSNGNSTSCLPHTICEHLQLEEKCLEDLWAVPVEPKQLYRKPADTQHPTLQPRCRIVHDFNYLRCKMKR